MRVTHVLDEDDHISVVGSTITARPYLGVEVSVDLPEWTATAVAVRLLLENQASEVSDEVSDLDLLAVRALMDREIAHRVGARRVAS